MSTIIKQGICKKCGEVKVEVNAPNHLLHFFLFLFTGGIWLIVWLLLIVIGDVRCSKCGAKARKYWLS